MVFDLVSANIIGPGIRYVQICNRKYRYQAFIICDESNIKTHLIHYMKKLGNEKNVTIGLRFDGKKAPPDLTLSTTYGAILGGAEPNHFVNYRVPKTVRHGTSLHRICPKLSIDSSPSRLES